MKIFAKIRFCWGSFVISFIVALLMIPLLFLFPKKKAAIIHHFNRLMLFLMGGKVQIEGRRDPDAQLYLINHQGIIDIIAMEASEPIHPRWVAKKELFDTPWFGHLLKLGDMISVDRDNKAGLIKLLKDCKESIEEKGRVVAIFPEGTRASSQPLLPFKAGAKLVAQKLGLKVQPVVITGSKQLLNEHNKTAHSSTVKITYLDSFYTDKADKDWYEKLSTDMQSMIDREKKELSRER